MPYLLDTVTISELRKRERMHPRVHRWQTAQAGQPGYLSVITLQEIRIGLLRLGDRDPTFRQRLQSWYASLTTQPAVFPILSVELLIAERAADFQALHGLSFADALIAATAETHGLTLATRNTGDFVATGIALVNPWEFDG